MMRKLVLSLTLGFFLFIVWVIYLANTGQGSVFFDLVGVVPYGDKLGHALLFGILTLGANAATKFKRFRLGAVNVFIGTVAVSLFVLIEELSQHFAATRTLDVWDLCADIVGIGIFTALSSLIAHRTTGG